LLYEVLRHLRFHPIVYVEGGRILSSEGLVESFLGVVVRNLVDHKVLVLEEAVHKRAQEHRIVEEEVHHIALAGPEADILGVGIVAVEDSLDPGEDIVLGEADYSLVVAVGHKLLLVEVQDFRTAVVGHIGLEAARHNLVAGDNHPVEEDIAEEELHKVPVDHMAAGENVQLEAGHHNSSDLDWEVDKPLYFFGSMISSYLLF